MISVLVVDDNGPVRRSLRHLLETADDIKLVATATNGIEAVEKARSYLPDVAVVDISMPRMDGIEATRRLAGPDVVHPLKVLILTTFDLDDYVYAALRSGARGFLLKDTPPEELVRALRHVAAGEALLAPSVTRRLIDELAQCEPAPTPPVELGLLTDREREVLTQMARGLSNAEIASELVLGETTVKTHVGRVLTKLGLRDRVQAVVLAYESGLVTPRR